MAAFKHLFIKEFRQFVATRYLPVMMIVMPLMINLLMPLVANMEVKNVKLGVVDHDRSVLSTRLIDEISESSYFDLINYNDTYAGALDELGLGKLDVILELPDGFEKELMTGKNVEVFMSANAVNNTKGSMGTGYLSSILTDFASELQTAAGMVLASAPATIEVQYRYNPHLNYRLFMVPAMMIMVLILLCGFIPTQSVVMEKVNGTIEQINVSPVSRLEFILTKVLFYGIMGLITLTIALTIGRFVYGICSYGGYAEIYVAAVLFLLFMSGFGMIISNISDGIMQAIFTMFFFIMIFMLMSGLFTGIASMATWAQYITYALPTRYFVELMRAVCLKGSNFTDLSFNYLMLTGFAVVTNFIAIMTYRKQS
ncbi:MAG: ABC transporter permease [Bacteroidales bacterium]|nr:ABC transporter permease [Bacteroidales bacterium]